MEDFEFSLWVFDENFLLSVTILVMGCFLTTFTFTKAMTSQVLADLVTGKTPRSQARTHRNARQEVLKVMRHHIDSVRDGRAYDDLEDWEKEHIKELREFYYFQVREINNKEGFYGTKQ